MVDLMDVVTISSGYRVVVPKRIREALALRPGQRLLALQDGDRVQLVPLVDARSKRGFLRGIDTDVPRDADDA